MGTWWCMVPTYTAYIQKYNYIYKQISLLTNNNRQHNILKPIHSLIELNIIINNDKSWHIL